MSTECSARRSFFDSNLHCRKTPSPAVAAEHFRAKAHVKLDQLIDAQAQREAGWR